MPSVKKKNGLSTPVRTRISAASKLAARQPRSRIRRPNEPTPASRRGRRGLEAVAVVGDRQHDAVAEPAQVHVDARRVRVALDVGQRLLEDPAQLAQHQRRQRARRRRASRPRGSRCARPSAPPRSGSRSAAAARRRRGRAARSAARAPPGPPCGRPRPACGRPPPLPAGRPRSGARAPAPRSRCRARSWPASRACRARAARARPARPSCAPARPARPRPRPGGRAARRAPAPATATIGYSAGSTTSVRKSTSVESNAERM